MNRLRDDLEDYLLVNGAWPTVDEVKAALPGNLRGQVDAFLVDLAAEGSVHVGQNGRIRVRPGFRIRGLT